MHAQLLLGTLRALAAPRRAVPLGLVLAAVLSAEWAATASATALLVDLALFSAFCLIAPGAWRLVARRAPTLAGHVAYVALGGLVVGVLAVALPRALGMTGTYVADSSALGVIVVLFLVGGWGLGRDIDLEEGVAAERERAARLAIEAERAQILALRSHFDPHFLFNTLNAIAEWCREDPRVAERATLDLAAMLRTILDAIRCPTWALTAELALVRQLFDLYEVRDRERYRFVIDAHEPPEIARVPPMLLLPLVENAITHGPSAGHAGPVTLTVRTTSEQLRVEIRNAGSFAGRRPGGEGIAMVERRLALAYGNGARLQIDAHGGDTLAVLELPLAPRVEETLPP